MTRSILLVLYATLCLPVISASASESTAILGEFAECKTISKKKARLKCFEQVLEDQESLALGANSEGVAVAQNSGAAEQIQSSTAPAEDPKATFGLSGFQRETRELASAGKEERKKIKAKQREESTISDRIAHVVTRGDGRRVIVLESGQVWLGSGDDVLTSLAAGDDIEILKSKFGGFRIKKPGRVGLLGVRRLD